VGRCADNAAAESFFGVLKRERVNQQHDRTRAEARADIFDHIRAVSQSASAAETGNAATGGATLTATARDNGVEPASPSSRLAAFPKDL